MVKSTASLGREDESAKRKRDFSLIAVMENGQCGFVDRQGNTVISPQFTRALPFREGEDLTAVSFGDRFAMINRQGRIIVQPEHRWFRTDADDEFFHIGDENRQGIVTRAGRLIVPPSLDFISDFDRNGIAPFRQGGRWGFINSSGRVLIRPQFGNPVYSQMHDIFPSNRGHVRVGDRFGYVDQSGQMAIPATFADAQNFDSSGLAFVAPASEGERLWGLIDTQGRYIVAPRFQAVGQAGFGNAPLAPVMINGRWGYINRSGQIQIEPRFQGAGAFHRQGENWTASVVTDMAGLRGPARWGLIDLTGNVVFGPVVAELIHDPDENGNRIVLEQRPFTSLVDPNNQILARSLESIRSAGNGYYFFRRDGHSGMLDRRGRIAVEPRFDSVAPGPEDGSLFFVKLGERWGWIDRMGSFIVNPRFQLCDLLNWQ